MNFYSILSFIIAFSVLAFGLFSSSKDMSVFLDGISVFIVVGGTFAATAISFRMDRILMLIKVFITRVIKGSTVDYRPVIESIIRISEKFHSDPTSAIEIAKNSKEPFLEEGVVMALDGFLKPRELVNILRSRVESVYQLHNIDANKFKTIGKFPPAFGMMGTTIGMIVLLANLGGADAAKTIGPAMGICLITTLYGVALANLVIIPIAENLMANSKEQKLKNSIIAEGVRLLVEGKNPVYLAEELNSFLLPQDRVNWKDIIKNA